MMDVHAAGAARAGRTAGADAIDADALLGRAEDLVRRALRAGAAEAEVYLERGAALDVDLEADAVSATNLARSQGGSVRVLRDDRLGFAYFSDPAAAEAAIDAALANTRFAPRKSYRLPTTSQNAARLPSRWDDAIAALDPGAAVETARELVAAAKDDCADGSVTGGGVGAGWSAWAVASSRGVAARDRETSLGAGVSLTLEDGASAIQAWDSATRYTGSIDAAAVAAGVAKTVMSLRDAADGPTGDVDMVLLPDAAMALLDSGVLPALDGDTAMRGKSVWSGRLGATVADEGFSIAEAPHHADGMGIAGFDGEGMPTRDVPLIAGGVLRSFLFDSWHAHEHGQDSTHSAVRDGFKSLPDAGTHHVLVSHERSEPLAKLIAGVDRGYLVDSVLGAHTANATTGDFSVTVPNAWRIERGAIAGAATTFAIGGNLPALLARVDGAADGPKHADGMTVPALRVRSVAASR
jgi:PmbA protein